MAVTSNHGATSGSRASYRSLRCLAGTSLITVLVVGAWYATYRSFWQPDLSAMTRRPGSILSAVAAIATTALAQTPSSTSFLTSTATSAQPMFTIPFDVDDAPPLLPNIYDSQAVNAQDVCPGYVASNVVHNSYGFTADLSLAGAACNVYGTDIDALSLTVEYQSADRLHVEIVPTYLDATNSSWYILPEELNQKPSIDSNADQTILDNDLDLVWNNDPSFSFKVLRQSTGDALFDTTGKKLVFENQFIEFASALPENYNLYGFGEVLHGLRMGNNFTRTFWAADTGDPLDYNIYGDHPFYLDTRYYAKDETTGDLTYASEPTSDGSTKYVAYSHGVYMRNSHGQEVLMRPSGLTWRTIGGSIDLYFYAGPTQQQVTKSYQLSTVGLPAMQQYFTFGYHQCRWGYKDWQELQDVVDSMAKFSLPLETIWSDIDYMNQYRDFDNDQVNFGYFEGQKFLSQLHTNGQHYVPIVDSAIYVPNPETETYPVFDRGTSTNSFLSNPDGSLYIGSVWPGFSAFPDWLSASLDGGGAFDWWTNEMSLFYSNVAFDGIWIDMNEVSSFCRGSCGSMNVSMNPVHPPFLLPGEPGYIIYTYPEGFNLTNATEAASAEAASASQASSYSTVAPSTTPTYLRTTPTPNERNILFPPYVINNVQGALDVHAVSPNATHHNGFLEYDFHNIWGHQILNATYNTLLNLFPTKRPFIIGRSTFPGTGKWAGHWGGDNMSRWAYMYFSIPQALSFSLFGIPLFGVDTCGFSGNSDEELCNRWMQLSAFFPFYRNHNVLSAIGQEPYQWASVIDASKTAMTIRYSLLPYIYTTFYLAHSTGSTVMRALAWEFPNDPSLASADRQFFFGDSLLITPVLTQGATSVDGVFPGVGDGEVWYDWYNQTAIEVAPGANVTIDAPLGHIPVYVRGGKILPIQEPGLTTRECRSNSWALLVAAGTGGAASGKLYIDDGESLVQNATLWIDVSIPFPSLPPLLWLTTEKFALTNNTLYASSRGTYRDSNPLANVTIMGVSSSVSSVSLNGKSLTTGWEYDAESKVFSITGLEEFTSEGAWSNDWSLRWS